MKNLAQRLVEIVPSERQLKWHELEFYAFIHFGINTFYDREWGDGAEDPSRFNPAELDTDQWVESLKEAGIKAAILTCKHHDGFCLWPSKYTKHSIKNSPFQEGKGDIVKAMAESCKKYGLKFGVYLSPWDRHEKTYGDSPKYNEYFMNQLTELLTQYGELFSVWFDGACGEGPNGKRQEYDWESYYELIRRLQPEAAITICGPDVRWCGNEAGHCRTSEWNVVPKRLAETEKIQEASQKNDDEVFRERPITAKDMDLGSREVLAEEAELIWYPAEVDTSIRPGWFYHENEDSKVKSLEKLLDIYYNSVGGNATLLLNIPPNTKGLISETDVNRLKEIGTYIRRTFACSITEHAKIHATEEEAGHSAQCVAKEDNSYYRPKEGTEAVELSFKFKEVQCINHVVLKEKLRLSQRIEAFEIWVRQEDELIRVYEGTVVGSRKICKFNAVSTNEVVVKVVASRVYPTLQFVGIYEETESKKATLYS